MIHWIGSREGTGGLNKTAFVEWLGDLKRIGRSGDSEYRHLSLNHFSAKRSREMRLQQEKNVGSREGNFS